MLLLFVCQASVADLGDPAALPPTKTTAQFAPTADRTAVPTRARAPRPKLAVVMDDMGYNLTLGRRVINLPVPVTVAILPHAPNAHTLAVDARWAGKEVILHQPMEAMNSRRREHGTLMLAMNRPLFTTTLTAALRAVPYSVGVSNHTGSLLTQHEEPMSWLMAHIGSRGLYFLDSRTTADTVAVRAARAWGVPVLRRDVFLDHEPTPEAIEAAFERVLGIARDRGHAVLIAHPLAQSVRWLETRLPALHDVQVVSAGDLARSLTPPVGARHTVAGAERGSGNRASGQHAE